MNLYFTPCAEFCPDVTKYPARSQATQTSNNNNARTFHIVLPAAFPAKLNSSVCAP